MSLERSESINIESPSERSSLIPTNINNLSIIDRNSKISEKITKKIESIHTTSQISPSQHTSPTIIKTNINSSSSTLINSNSNSNLNTHNNNNINNSLTPNYNSPQATSFLSALPIHNEHHGGGGFHIHRRQSFLHRTDSDFDMQTPKALLLRLQIKEQ